MVIKSVCLIFAVYSITNCTDAAVSAKQNLSDMLTYTKKEINRNFKIKVSGIYEGQKINTLVGVNGLVKLVADIELTNRLLDRAFNSTEDKVICRLRRGLRIGFYVH